jgi:hypothetical protein
MPDEEEQHFRRREETKPNPDPTDKTTESLLREIKGLKEFLQAEVKVLASELKGEVKKISEQFAGVDNRFKSSEENKKLAFDAAEKANTKTEALVTKLIDGLSKRIDELRDSEQRTAGSKEGTQDKSRGVGDTINHIITLAALAVAVIALFIKHGS